MVTRDEFAAINDGDQLDDGYFNGINNKLWVSLIKTDINVFVQHAQSIVKSDEVLWTSLSSTLSNGAIDETNSTALVGGAADNSKAIYFCTKFDDFEDASIDSTKWSTSTAGEGTVTESGGFINAYAGDLLAAPETGTATVISDGSSGLDFRSFSGNSEVVFYYEITDSSTGNGTTTTQIQISNGTTHVDTTLTGSGYARIIFNKTGETCDIYADDGASLLQNDLDISSVTTNWYIRLSCFGNVPSNPGTATSRIKLQEIGYVDGSTGSSTAIFTDTAASTTATGLAVIETSNTTSTPVIGFSADSGANFVTDSNENLINTSNTGTGIQFRITGDHPTTISATSKNIMRLDKFGGIYG